MREKPIIGAILISLWAGTAQAETTLYPTVAELFTSQACASCPGADMLMKQKADADPGLLVLSYHVNYWDHLGWKDPYSLQASTNRQRGYYTALNQSLFYTPELVVNGEVSMIGSDDVQVTDALSTHVITLPPYNIEIAPEGKKGRLWATINTNGAAPAPARADIWEVAYMPYALTLIGAGENEGRTVENLNSVKAIRPVGTIEQTAHIALPDLTSPRIGTALIIQTENFGPILAAATYQDGAR